MQTAACVFVITLLIATFLVISGMGAWGVGLIVGEISLAVFLIVYGRRAEPSNRLKSPKANGNGEFEESPEDSDAQP